jgi:iron-sulfur cluster assembly accessory protein
MVVISRIESQEMLETSTATLAEQPPVALSEAAAARISAILKRQPGSIGLRLAVNGGGCSGFSYQFELVDNIDAEDLVIETNGAKLIVDPTSTPFLEGSVVDYVQELIGASFQVRNPNAKSGCGCGTSFSI